MKWTERVKVNSKKNTQGQKTVKQKKGNWGWRITANRNNEEQED
jgi:hypothetical protein